MMIDEMIDGEVINSVNEHIALQCCSKVRGITRAFHETFNSSFFSYIKYYWNGSCLILCDRTDWMKCFLQDGLYSCLGGMPDIRFRDSVFFDDCEKDSPYEKFILKRQVNEFDISHGVSLIKRYDGYIEIFNYAAPSHVKHFRSSFLQNEKYFNMFCIYFLDKARKLIRGAESSKFFFPNLENNNINFSVKDLVEKSKLNQLEDLLMIKRFYLGNELYITSREFDCMKLLVRGHSYKVIAKALNISYSTVQEYVNNMRYKLACKNKRHLIETMLASELNTVLSIDDNKNKRYWHNFMTNWLASQSD